MLSAVTRLAVIGFIFVASLAAGTGASAQSNTCLVRLSRAVPNVCKPASQLQPNEFDARDIPAWFENLTDQYNGGACPTNEEACAVQKGEDLCAWYADTITGEEGLDFSSDLGCYAAANCERTFQATDTALIPPDGNPCGAGTVCCIPKSNTPGVGVNPDAEGESVATAKEEAAAGAPVTLPDPLGGVSVPVFFGNVIRVLSSVAGAIALLMFVYGGMMWIVSGGDQSKIRDAQKIIMNASIGLVLIFGAYLFTSAIIGSILANPTS